MKHSQAEKTLGRFTRRMEVQNQERLAKHAKAAPKAQRWLAYLVVLTITAVAIAAQYQIIFGKYLNWPPASYSSAKVFNLTTAKIPWQIFYGESPICGDIHCYVLPSQKMPSSVAPQPLPMPRLDRANYVRGANIYYRTQLQMPADLLANTAEPWYLQTKYVWGDKVDVYLNGTLVHSGVGGTGINIPVPNAMLRANLPLTIAVRIEAGDRSLFGLPAVSQIAMLPKSLAIANVPYLGDKISDLFFLFAMPRISLVLVFCLIFLSIRQSRESLWFALFGFLSTMQLLLAGDGAMFLGKSFLATADPIILGTLADCAAQLCLLRFVFLYFRRLTPTAETFWSILAGGTCGSILFLQMSVDTSYLSLAQSMIAKSLRYLTLATAIGLAGQNIIYLLVSKKSRTRLIAHIVLLASLLLCILPFTSDWLGTLDSGSSFGKYIYESALFLIFAGLTIYELSAGMNQRLILHRLMARYVDSDLADEVVRQDKIVSPNREIKATVMVCDIRSYTVATHMFAPDAVVKMLNQYFDLVATVVNKHGGMVSKFMGDGVLAYWPESSLAKNDPPPMAAARAAIELRGRIKEWNLSRIAAGDFPVAIGMAITHGDVYFGEIGSASRADLTLIGDVINSCARLESLTKHCQHDILLSSEVFAWINVHALAALVPREQLSIVGRKADAFRLIAVYDNNGTWQHHEPAFSQLVAKQRKAGLIECDVRNLHVPDYSHSAKSA